MNNFRYTVKLCSTTNKPDSNGRVYPKSVIEEAIEKYNEELKNNKKEKIYGIF